MLNFATKQLNVLLVEDDDADVMAVKRAFSKAGMAVNLTRAVDGQDALDILKGLGGQAKPNLPFIMLVDQNIPRFKAINPYNR